MKYLFGPDKPEYVVDAWPGQSEIFSWLDYLITVPRPISIITTCKENGAPNACPDAWGTLIGGGNQYSSLIAVYLHYHTYANLLREKEWCINFPDATLEAKWDETIRSNGLESDEITEAGFTVEPSQTIKAPRIADCPVNLECRLEWERPLYEGSNLHLFCGRVTALAMEESLANCGTEERLRALNLLFHVQGQLNPLSGERLNPSRRLSILQYELH
jgi:flavin reductase (DIM6/NTAB) family NADH-FMN oxidoreductase RutF